MGRTSFCYLRFVNGKIFFKLLNFKMLLRNLDLSKLNFRKRKFSFNLVFLFVSEEAVI